MLNEPVRGSLPEAAFFSLPGLDQLNAFRYGRMPSTPLARLLGHRITQASSGTAVVNQPISPWFEITNDGFVDLSATTEAAIFCTALTGAPPGTMARTVNVSMRYLRPCTVDDEMVIVRGRILHAGSSFTTVEALVEDALGRAVAHATGSVLIVPIDPPPPKLAQPPDAIDEPVYPSPDPPSRPLPPKDQLVSPPLYEFLGAEVVDRSKGRAVVTMPMSGWFCQAYKEEVAAGIVGSLMSLAGGPALRSYTESDDRLVIINQTASFLAPLRPDGRAVTAVATVCGQTDGVLVATMELTDADGRLVMMAQGTGMFREGAQRRSRATDRLLLSVLFTDVVGSTERAGQLGDARWRELLEEHHALARRHFELHKGREVKTTGDGFLATFDSPTRAVECARAIVEGMERLGLRLRAGLHTGECEVGGGDISGLAVHIAQRVSSKAQPGEVVVSSTVKDLVSGSGIEFEDRGEHELKGVPRTWRLYAVKDPDRPSEVPE